MASNNELGAAKNNKKDEFYTQLTDIEKEMRYYRKHFKGKTVLCNCDDPFESNFFKYFVLNFNKLKLKKLIATCYCSSSVAGTKLKLNTQPNGQLMFSFTEGEFDTEPDEKLKKPYKAIVNVVRDANGDGGIDMLDVVELFNSGENELVELEGDGDFRSEECLELLKETDIIVTNPPFSLFREYVNLLIEHEKHFIIIGNVNAITYKDFFPLLKENKVWIGASIHSGDRKFYVPDEYPLNAAGCGVDEDGRRFIRVKGVRWFTNLDFKQRHEELILVKRYSPENYPKFDNYDAINVDKTADIPCDYPDIMGVPITFMDKYSPEQFEIIGYTAKDMGVECLKFYEDLEQSLNGGEFKRNMKSARFSPMIVYNERPEKTCYRASNVEGYMLKTYGRVLIRNKNPEVPKGE